MSAEMCAICMSAYECVDIEYMNTYIHTMRHTDIHVCKKRQVQTHECMQTYMSKGKTKNHELGFVTSSSEYRHIPVNAYIHSHKSTLT